MLLKSFDDQLPHLALVDKCHILLSEEGLVAGFDLIDCYCPDPQCDCCKVSFIIKGSDNNIYATISYGWRSPSFYRKWGLDQETTTQLTSGFLDPLAEQSRFADVFLEPFSMMSQDPNFIDRIKKRYTLFKKAVADDQPSRNLSDNVIIPFKARRPK